jgi:SAM-dependent methyltransferase
MKPFTIVDTKVLKIVNIDPKTVAGFGDEWDRFDQSYLSNGEQRELYEKYFWNFPWQTLPPKASGFDMGCGSGRWAKIVAPRVGTLHCIDPSSAIEVAKRNLREHSNCVFHVAGVGDEVLPERSMDFGYSLGVLHHVPDTARGIRDCVRMLKPGAPFLVYLYYALDNRSFVYRVIWKTSNLLRLIISRLPFGLRFFISQLIAIFVYWPFSRCAAIMEFLGIPSRWVNKMPLSFYQKLSFYTMRTDALDRFGTRLEQRFTLKQIKFMLESAGLTNIIFSKSPPYWCAIGIRKE